jgi:hypothetical protein
LQLAQLAADVGLGEARGLDQGRHIPGPLFEQAEELQAGGFAEEAEKLAVFLQQLGAGQGVRQGHGSAFYDGMRIMAGPWGWGSCVGG